MQLPIAKDPKEITSTEAVELILCIPAIAKYLSSCVSEGEGDSYISVEIVAAKGVRKWNMKLNFPSEVFDYEEEVTDPNFPKPEAVRTFLRPQQLLSPEKSEVVTKVELRGDNDRARTDRSNS